MSFSDTNLHRVDSPDSTITSSSIEGCQDSYPDHIVCAFEHSLESVTASAINAARDITSLPRSIPLWPTQSIAMININSDGDLPTDIWLHDDNDSYSECLGAYSTATWPAAASPNAVFNLGLSCPSSPSSLHQAGKEPLSISASPYSAIINDCTFSDCDLMPLPPQSPQNLRPVAPDQRPPTPSTVSIHQFRANHYPCSPSRDFPWPTFAEPLTSAAYSLPPTPCASELDLLAESPHAVSSVAGMLPVSFAPIVESTPEPDQVQERRMLVQRRVARVRQRNNISEHDKRPQCHVCNKVFSREFNLKSHLQTHNQDREKEHSCQYCPRSFTRPHDLNRHIDGGHLRLKPFPCDVCGKSFARKDTLRRHVEGNCLARIPQQSTVAGSKRTASARAEQSVIEDESVALSPLASASRLVSKSPVPLAGRQRGQRDQSSDSLASDSVIKEQGFASFTCKQE